MIPPRHTVGVKTFVPGGEKDAHGNAKDTWTDPVDRKVFSIGPRMTFEPITGRSEVIKGLTVYAPGGFQIGARDRLVIDGADYEVDGEPADWTRGPFTSKGGVAIDLKRVEG